MKISGLFLFTYLSMVSIFTFSQPSAAKFETIQTFQTKEAHQGVAIDQDFIYTINTKSIAKYDKKSGEFIFEWKDTLNQIIHFDGGVVVNEKLYCAHSNYPGIPMTSSIEVFNKNTLEHIESHSFGIKYGSCTWADYYNHYWWVCFSNYDKFETETNRDTRWTLLVKFDRHWNDLESWVFPEKVLSELKPMSCSGGSWGPDGNLYITGHDSTKVYILQLPEKGSVLTYLKSIKVEFNGQGIAWDRFDLNYLFGIIRKKNIVIKSKPATQ
jgi:hypothetical protein